MMESQTFEQPPQTTLQPSRPQSDDINAIARHSRAERPRNYFLLTTLCLAFVSSLSSFDSLASLGFKILFFSSLHGSFL